jgi:hypothetical protein
VSEHEHAHAGAKGCHREGPSERGGRPEDPIRSQNKQGTAVRKKDSDV